MVQVDYRGARSANAGDDFHELWALRQALALLDRDTRLTAVAVEGLKAEDERGTPPDTWDGVDCTFYYGGDQAASAERIIIDQLKYSAANPDRAWTIARLTQSSNQKKDNSVIGRLAKAFGGLKSKRPDLIANRNVPVRLVSNQPIDPAVVIALSDRSTSNNSPHKQSKYQSDFVALFVASGLPGEDLEAFTTALDLSECGRGPHFALEENVLVTIAYWTNDDALLVIAVDAADNSVTAASTQSPPEKSFVHDFLTLGELPKNVRCVVTARTGRLFMLNLPHGFTRTEIIGFSCDETAAHVRGFWDDAPDTWIDDFHHLSSGNPRVQRYALDYGGAEPAQSLDYLRPNGKGLTQVFREQREYALRKQGHAQDIKAFCAGLIALPRPVPIDDLLAVTGLRETHIRDLCSDLAPGVRLTNTTIGFADEDFEHFIRAEAATELSPIQPSSACLSRIQFSEPTLHVKPPVGSYSRTRTRLSITGLYSSISWQPMLAKEMPSQSARDTDRSLHG